MSSAPQPLSVRDRSLLAAMRAIPRSLASHLMFLLQSHPGLADRWGYHVRRMHYYDPLPDFPSITPAAASRRRLSPAVDFDVDAQVRLACRLASAFGAELAGMEPQFDFSNAYFGGLDAALYYALIRDLRPARVVEIGSGMSTRIAAAALARNRNAGRDSELICIEPFPAPRLTSDMPPITLIQQRVEELPLDLFERLQPNDILFIDSSHVLKFGGDVCREFLDILPVLRPGVWVHVHDVFFPNDYPATWLIEERRAYNEQYVLEAFLAFNRAYAVRLCGHWLWSEHRDMVGPSLPGPVVDGSHRRPPASFWMTRVA
jgi:hypothetical protein